MEAWRERNVAILFIWRARVCSACPRRLDRTLALDNPSSQLAIKRAYQMANAPPRAPPARRAGAAGLRSMMTQPNATHTSKGKRKPNEIMV